MSLEVTPLFEKWNQQSDPFIGVFKAWDDKGNKCKGNKFFIEYSMTFDDTMPDLNNMTKIYSDASGLITLTITMPCVLSIYATFPHDMTDSSKGETKQELAINYKITFKPIILSFKVTYKNSASAIPITNKWRTYDILAITLMSDGTNNFIEYTDLEFDKNTIELVGNNIINVSYYDSILDIIWTAELIIPGIPKLLSMQAIYIGKTKLVGDRIIPEEFYVTGNFLTAIDTQEEIVLTPDQWKIIDIPLITEANGGIFKIEHALYYCSPATVAVPYKTSTFLQLNVWYEGDKIEVGKTYNPNDLVIFLVYPELPDKIRITPKECSISSYQIIKEGWNWFTVTYSYQYKQVRQWFPIMGIVYKKYIDLDFKVVYIDDTTKQETDFTKEFKDSMSIDDTLFISWNVFLATVNQIKKYGMYIMTAPKAKGLSNQHDTDWEVLCIDDTTLKASIKYIYEEEENG